MIGTARWHCLCHFTKTTTAPRIRDGDGPCHVLRRLAAGAVSLGRVYILDGDTKPKCLVADPNTIQHCILDVLFKEILGTSA